MQHPAGRLQGWIPLRALQVAVPRTLLGVVHSPKSAQVALGQLSSVLEEQRQRGIIFHYGQKNYEVQTSVPKKINKLLGISISDG